MMDRNQLIFAMGVIKGMLASATDEDIKMSLNISLEFMGKTLQGYEFVKKTVTDIPEEPEPDAPEELQHPVEEDAPPVEAPWAADEYMTPPETGSKED